MTTLATKSGSLVLKDGKIAQGCACCEEAFCCPSDTLPPFLELTISNFSSARGDFTDFNPNQTYLLGFPEISVNQHTGAQTALPRKCVCYNAIGIIQDESFADETRPCVFGVSANVNFQVIYEWGVGISSPTCRYGLLGSANEPIHLYGYLNSRTTDLPNSVSHVRMLLDANAADLGIGRLDFIDALCDRTLSISGSASVNFTNLRQASFTCINSGPSVTFDWSLAVSQAP